MSRAMLTGAEVTTWLLGPPLLIVVTVVSALVLRWALHRLVDRVVRAAVARHRDRLSSGPTRSDRVLTSATGVAPERQVQRMETLAAVLHSVGTATIFGIAILTVMAIVGIPLAPLLASAGVGGVALGFGAQSLVKDFLSGIFMIVEDQYGVGDFIDTGEATGFVEDVSLRVTRLRDATGRVWYVRNGEILRVGNHSQGWSLAVVDMLIGYDEDVSEAVTVIGAAVKGLEADPAWADIVIEEPKVAGVESVTAGGVAIRVEARCAPTHQVGVQREIRQRVKAALDAAGFRGPVAIPPPGVPPVSPAIP
jgi:small conductance mechanosensitive channel